MSSAPRAANLIRLGAVGGTPRYYAVQTKRADGEPSRVRLTPQQAFGQLTTIGDTAQVSDQRTASLIFGTGGGLGRAVYQETEGLTQYRWGGWDTRVEGAAVLPLAATQLGAATSLSRDPVRIEYLGLPGAVLVAWVPFLEGFSTQAENVAIWTGAAWVTPTVPLGWPMKNLTGFARYGGYFYFASNDSLGFFFRSTDGLTWNSIAVSTARGCCVHDNKFYTYFSGQRIYYSLDPATLASWQPANEVLDLHPNEEVMQLFEWEDESRRKCVHILTTQRLLRFDDEAKTYTQVDDFSGEIWASAPGTNTFLPSATVWKADNNLYVNFYDRAGTNNNADTIMQYTRQQKGFIAPNKLGGLPTAQQVAITHTVGGLNYLFAFGAAPAGSGNVGQVFAWDGQGWHPLYRPAGAGTAVWGGGYGRGTLYTARADKTIVSQAYGDNRIRPEYRTGATYDTAAGGHPLRFAVTDGGTENLKKRELWLTVVARKASRAFGLDAGCRIDAYRAIDGGADVALDSATSATTFPWRVDLSAKASWYEMEVVLYGFSTVASVTPALVSAQLHYDRTPPDVRDSHDFVIDLTDAAGEHGRSAAAIAAELLALRGQLVTLAYGAGAWGDRTSADVAVTCGIFQAALEADPLRGPVLMRCEVRDVSTPNSG